MSAATKNRLRTLLVITLGFFTVLMAYDTFTAPMIASTGPAILTVAGAVGTFFAARK